MDNSDEFDYIINYKYQMDETDNMGTYNLYGDNDVKDVYGGLIIESHKARSILPMNDEMEIVSVEEGSVCKNCENEGDRRCHVCVEHFCSEHGKTTLGKDICDNCYEVCLENDRKTLVEHRKEHNSIKEKDIKMPFALPTSVRGAVPSQLFDDDEGVSSSSPSPKTPKKPRGRPKKTTTSPKATKKATPSPKAKKVASPTRKPTANGPPVKLPGLSESKKFYYNSKGEKKSVKSDEKGLFYLGANDRVVRIKS